VIFHIAKSAGFCFGVKRAIKMALDTASRGKQVEMLGDIVHNEEVVAQIEAAGIKKVSALSPGEDRILLIRAHGAAKHLVERARAYGYTIVDATCPMVKEIHTIVENAEQDGYAVIIIGDNEHEEVEGIKGQVASPVTVIESLADIPCKTGDMVCRAAVVVQSTQSLDHVLTIEAALRERIGELKFFNTICKATTTRQNEIKTLPLRNDVVLIVGSRSSANTRRLYEIALALNRRTHWIQTKQDINNDWLLGASSVGIAAGASTPESTIGSVAAYVASL